jgi:hypothetical protein
MQPGYLRSAHLAACCTFTVGQDALDTFGVQQHQLTLTPAVATTTPATSTAAAPVGPIPLPVTVAVPVPAGTHMHTSTPASGSRLRACCSAVRMQCSRPIGGNVAGYQLQVSAAGLRCRGLKEQSTPLAVIQRAVLNHCRQGCEPM